MQVASLLTNLAKQSDLEELYQLEVECFSMDRIGFASYRKLLEKPDIKILVIRSPKKIIGSAIIVLRKKTKTARIYSFAVGNQYRGKKVAERLFNNVEDFLIKKKYKKIILEVKKNNIAALKFYLKAGLVQFGIYKNYYQDGKDAIRMSKELTPKIRDT